MFLTFEEVWGFIRPAVVEIILSIIAVVIGELAIYYFVKSLSKPKITFRVLQKDDKLGFGVSVGKKTIIDARVRCNGIDYDWEGDSGVKIDQKNLYPGDVPSYFFPYRVKARYVRDISKYANITIIGKEPSQGGIIITVSDALNGKQLYLHPSRLPKNTDSFHIHSLLRGKIDASIRLIGQGIEETKDYYINIRLKNLEILKIIEDKPVIKTVTYDFALKQRRFGLA